MSLLQAIILGIIQGATEFLPVSSSGHLVIVPYLLDWPDPGLTLGAILHLGTLVAVLAYFWRDVWRLALAALASLRNRSLADPHARIAWAIAIGTVPGAVIGFLLEDWFEQLFSNPRAAAGFLLVTAAILAISARLGSKQQPIGAMSWLDGLLIGLAQTLAIIPGISRSGATISAGLLRGYRREDATRFSFFLSIPIILGSGLYQVLKLVINTNGASQTPLPIIGAGFLAAAVTGYLCIAALLMIVRRQSLWPFSVYCATLGLLVLTGALG